MVESKKLVISNFLAVCLEIFLNQFRKNFAGNLTDTK